MEGVLRVPGHDAGIRHRRIEHGKHARVVGLAVAVGHGHGLRDDVPMPGRIGSALAIRPKARDLRLIRRARRAIGRAQVLGFVVFIHPLLARERRRAGRHISSPDC